MIDGTQKVERSAGRIQAERTAAALLGPSHDTAGADFVDHQAVARVGRLR